MKDQSKRCHDDLGQDFTLAILGLCPPERGSSSLPTTWSGGRPGVVPDIPTLTGIREK
jgi:hypothetical protein